MNDRNEEVASVPPPLRHVRWNPGSGCLEFSRTEKPRSELTDDDFPAEDWIQYEAEVTRPTDHQV